MRYFGLKIVAVCAACLAFPFISIHAQTPEASLDGQVDLGSDVHLFNTMVGDPLSPDFKFDETTTRGLIRLILGNYRLAPEERDALNELARTDIQTVKFSVNGATVNVPVADVKGRRVIGLVFKKVNMEALWNKGLEGKTELAELNSLSAAHKNKIEKFVAGKLHAAWQQSNIVNEYAPWRKALGEAHTAHQNGLAEDDHKTACKMYHDGAEYLDKYLKDAIPDYLYEWLGSSSHG